MHDEMLKNEWIMCCFALLLRCSLGMSDLFAMEIKLMTNLCMVLSNNLFLRPENFQTQINSAWICCGIVSGRRKLRETESLFST